MQPLAAQEGGQDWSIVFQMDYKAGLERLGPLVPDFLRSAFEVQRGRLLENLEEEWLYGGDETLRNTRARR